MSAVDIQILLGSIAGVLVVLGGGSKWLLSYVDAIQVKSALAEERARTSLSSRLHEEIKVLRDQLESMRTRENLYMRRIYQLESFIHQQPGIDIPTMTGWPPL